MLCMSCRHAFACIAQELQDSLSELYDESYGGFREDLVFAENARKFIREYIAQRVAPGSSALDVGCGNGEFLRALTDAGYQAEGLDFSGSSVKACRSRGLVAHEGDFRTYAFEHSFDLVTFWDVLEHLPEPGEFLRAAYRHVRPGGWVLAKVPGHKLLSIASAATWPRLGRALLMIPHHLQFFSVSSLQKLLSTAGFDQAHCTEIPPMRSQAAGGSLRRRAGRAFVRSVQRASGDESLLILAARPRDATGR